MVRVLLFASYADAIGSDEVAVELGDSHPVRVRDVVGAVQKLSPVLLPPKPLVAVNAEYATSDTVISASDEVAIIPPVAGG